MRLKKTKILSLFLLCAMFCLCFAGCGAESDDGTKSISVNSLNSTMKFKNVNYYDFYGDVYVGGYSGSCTVISNSLNSTEIWFFDAQNNTRVAYVNTPFSQRPETVKVYTNYAKTKYDTYNCKY